MRNLIKRSIISALIFSLLIFTTSTGMLTAFAADTDGGQAGQINELSNSEPIIMVHGLFGWGNDELFGIHYWGGQDSLKDLLTEKGYTVYTPTIGPIASNWDRACELYAYIKGGTVDYGKEHSEREGHARFGRTYEGVYPQWGSSKKIHLIGHSMGGETIRVLAQLIENGDPDEIENNKTDISPLLAGNHHWIDSITTIATPHDGSQEDEKQQSLEPFVHQLFAGLAVSKQVINSSDSDYDFKMEQWGLSRKEGETFQNYQDRVFASNIWKETHDLSIWDLSQEGAKELNSWVHAQKDIYYFSIACVDTHKDLFSDYQIPNINMSPLLWKSSLFMGRYTNDTAGKVKVDSSWWRNDGIVSVRSAIGPHEGSTDKIITYQPQHPVRGSWNYMGEIQDVDHIQVVGQNNPQYQKYLQGKFIEWAKMLSDLPE